MGIENRISVLYTSRVSLPEIVPNDRLEKAKEQAKATASMLAAQHALPEENVRAKMKGFDPEGRPQFLIIEENTDQCSRGKPRETRRTERELKAFMETKIPREALRKINRSTK